MITTMALLMMLAADGSPAPPIPPPPPTAMQITTPEGVVDIVKQSPGKIVVVNFWASFCLPCLVELPALLQLRDELGPQAKFVFVSFDAPEDASHAQVILQRRKIAMTSLISSSSPDAWHKSFPDWDGSVPHTIVYGRDGAMLLEIDGELDAKLFAAQLKALAARKQ
jgi:thiol-disulfide isomerase/thioredoxin